MQGKAAGDAEQTDLSRMMADIDSAEESLNAQHVIPRNSIPLAIMLCVTAAAGHASVDAGSPKGVHAHSRI